MLAYGPLATAWAGIASLLAIALAVQFSHRIRSVRRNGDQAGWIPSDWKPWKAASRRVFVLLGSRGMFRRPNRSDGNRGSAQHVGFAHVSHASRDALDSKPFAGPLSDGQRSAALGSAVVRAGNRAV